MIWRKLILIFALTSLLAAAIGQKVEVPVWEYPRKTYTIKDGLSQGQIIFTYLDSRGFTWVATKEGVDRFDGLAFLNFKTDSTFIRDYVRDIQEDFRGNVWFSGRKGIYRYDGSSFSFYPLKYSYRSPSIILFEDAVGFKTLEINDPTLYKYVYEKDTIIEGSLFPELIENGKRNWGFYQNIDSVFLVSLYSGSSENRVYKLYEVKHNQVKLLSTSNYIQMVKQFPPSDSILYFQEDDHLFKYQDGDYSKDQAIIPPNKGSLNLINNQLVVRNFSTLQLRALDGDEYLQIFNHRFFVNQICNAPQGFNISTERGLTNLLFENAFQFYPFSNGMPSGVWGILEADNGNILFSSYSESKIIRYDGKTYKTIFEKPGNRKFRFYPAELKVQNGDMWFSASNKLVIIDQQENVQVQDNPLLNYLMEYNGKVYGAGNGLYEFSGPDLEKVYSDEDGLNMDSLGYFEVVEVDTTGKFWMGAHLGLATWDGVHFKNYYVGKDLSSGILSIRKDHRNNLWFGTKSGISFYDYSMELPKSIFPEKFNQSIRWVEMIDTSYVLFGGSGELYLLDLPKFYQGEFDLYTITEEDGFSGEACLQNGSFKDSKGHIWIGTADGVVKLDPSRLKLHKTPTEPHFSYFSYQKDGGEKEILHRIPLGETAYSVRANSTDRNFEIQFFTINNHKPKSITYQHRLKGYEETWSVPKATRFVSYNNLPVGEYEFELQTCLNGKCTAIKSLFLEIKPVKALDFFWVRLALWILGGLIVATAIWYFLKNRRTQQQAEKAKFDQMKMQKNLAIHKITPHFTFNVLTALSTLVLKKNPETAVDYISRFANLYRPLMVNEGKLFRTLRDEIQFNKDYLELEKLRFPKRFEFEINVAEEVNLESYVPSMAIHSFVNNAVKHGMEAIEKNGIVRIGIKEIDDILTVEIIDNGIGRSQSKAFSGKYNKGEGIKITQDIFNFLNQNFPKKSEIATIEDLYNKTPTGTRVVLKIYAKYPKEI
ncbi:MAG: hypothetical protein ACI9XB_000415 [Gammaproteobacteria bacterium]|jgi:hypothetical protein